MLRIAYFVAVGLIAIHGLIHLMGFVAYWPLAEIAELPYKTAVWGGRLNLGQTGMRIFSLFWLLAAVGLAGSAIGQAAGRTWWLPVMFAAVVVSVAVTALDWSNAFRGTLISLILLIPLLLAAGLRMQPRPFSPYPQSSQPMRSTAVPTGLPAPVARYYEAALGAEAPVVETAVITGRGTVRFMGVTFPARLRFTHDAGQGYRHYIETTIFGLPLMKVNERYLDGHAWMQLPVGIIENEPKVDMAANLGLWGESIWLPSIYLTDSRVRWEAIDDTSARLIVPFETEDDMFTVFFDPTTNLITRMQAMRYRDADDIEKISWQMDVVSWDTFHGILIPARSTVIWADEGTPWLITEVEDIAYNVDVREYIRAEGL